MERRAKAVKRGADEVDFLGTRARSTPLGAAVVGTKLADLTRRVLAFDGYHAGESHDHGTELVELYMRHADVVLGFRSFKALLEEKWPLDLSVAYERMRVARLCTHDQAVKFGYTVCVLGLRIMRMLGLESFEQFLKRPLELHPSEGGGTVRFPAPAPALRSVLRQLASHAAEGHALDVGKQLRRYREVLDQLIERDPQVAALQPILWADSSGAYVRVSAGGAAESGAAARLYQKLARLGD